ncbi:MAG: hypothetical protein COC14_00160 [Burkholderiaceae bacterium]|nr:MAG: hypothetical protein COC14_00160 [Burkholderiaceae bacterium]
MATRPVFIPDVNGDVGVKEKLMDFEWFPGLAVVQKQKSIESLHGAAINAGISRLLEISSKSEETLGVNLSAFNLQITTKRNKKVFTVETAFQGSKVFEQGGPFTDLLMGTSKEAKKDIRLKESGDLKEFEFFGSMFPLRPRTFFYDWLYINALNQNEKYKDEVLSYRGFTDIEFNPKKSINCQAYSVALFVSLERSGKLKAALKTPEMFLDAVENAYNKKERQQTESGSQAVQGTLV